MLTEALLVFAHPSPSENTVECLSLTQPVPTHQYASNSVLLSLAAHLTFKFPFLDLSNFSKKCPKIKPQPKQINQHLTNHPLQEFWCDVFSQAIIKNHAIRKNSTLNLVLELSDSQFSSVMKHKQNLVQFSMNYEQNWIDSLLKKVSKSEQLIRKNTNIAYMNVSGSQLRTDPYMPIINVRALLLGQIYNNENWNNFNVLRGEVPTFEELLEYDGVIITGSTNSVLSQIQQIQKMSRNLFKAFQMNKKLKIFGICYGHQLIALKNKSQVVKRKRTDKVEKVKLDESIINRLKGSFGFLEGMISKECENLLLEHHQDYVDTVSDDFYVLGMSESCKVQCMLHKSGRMLSFQSHPQYFYEYTHGYMQRLMNYKYNEQPQQTNYPKDQTQLLMHHDSSIRMRMVISEFLNSSPLNN